MRRAVLPIALLSLTTFLAAQDKTAPSAATLARGKYLVERIGMCGDCHTPHDEKGEPIKEQWLKAIVSHARHEEFHCSIRLPARKPGYIDRLIRPGHGDERFERQDRLPARPPMPQYRYTQKDAEAVVAYLKSLGK